MVSEDAKKILLEVARDSIEQKSASVKIKTYPSILDEKRGVFVTLTTNEELRGCMGFIEPVTSIIEAVVSNAVSAAYYDPRFPSLTQEEFNKIKIEISILTKPELLSYDGVSDLLSKLNTTLGVIIQLGCHGATFLPQVWEDLSDKKEFLSQLCIKAGMPADEWKKGRLKVKTYEVEKFGE